MAVSNTQVTCPKCRTTLRPAKPLPAGKQVTCPKCKTTFIAPGANPDEAGAEEAPVKKKAGPAKAAAGGPVAKKGKPSKPASPAKAKPAKPARPADDEEEGGTYGFVAEKEEDDEDKPKIAYAPDTSIKDLRGPAQSAVMAPSNKLMFVGCIGFIGWLAAMVIMLIPVLFPVDQKSAEDEEKEKAAAAASNASSSSSSSGAETAKKKESPKRSFFDIGDIPMSKIANMEWYMVILLLPLPAILGMLYSAGIAFGAIKMQELESRGWGLASSIMALLPFNTAGAALVIVLFLQMLMGMVLDFDWFLYAVLGGIAGLMWLIQAVIGITGLATLMKPEVIAGFEFEPD